MGQMNGLDRRTSMAGCRIKLTERTKRNQLEWLVEYIALCQNTSIYPSYFPKVICT